MAILNFNFTKIDVERKANLSKEVKVESKTNIKDVKPSNIGAGAKQKAFVIEFQHEIKYEPNIGHIILGGSLLYLTTDESADELEKSWKDKKVLPKDVAVAVLNKVLNDCNIEALILSKEISLPAPIQLPKIKAEVSNETKTVSKK